MQIEEKFMARCIELARHGAGRTAPNPMVGAVVVHEGLIIGEGYHRCFGEPHAEVNAIASVKDEALLPDSTIYVSLEPCSHYGKTPPCAELIIRKGIKRVVIGCLDPFPQVSGRGVKMLREAGIEVVTGIMEAEARQLNEAFMTFQECGRPFITLKWAESADGYMDKERTSSSQLPELFSTPVTQVKVHKLRAESAAILVGTNTALLDNPSLTVRHWSGKTPVRLVVDRIRKISRSAHLQDDSVPTILFTDADHVEEKHGETQCVELDFERDIIPQILEQMGLCGLNSLLVEGGTNLLQQFIDRDCWDRIIIEHSPRILQSGVLAPEINHIRGMRQTESFGGHTFLVYEKGYAQGMIYEPGL